MPVQVFWAYLRCGHRASWMDRSGRRVFPVVWVCPKCHVARGIVRLEPVVGAPAPSSEAVASGDDRFL